MYTGIWTKYSQTVQWQTNPLECYFDIPERMRCTLILPNIVIVYLCIYLQSLREQTLSKECIFCFIPFWYMRTRNRHEKLPAYQWTGNFVIYSWHFKNIVYLPKFNMYPNTPNLFLKRSVFPFYLHNAICK